MKNKVLTTIAAIALFMTLAVGTTYAQSDVIKVNIPFDFTISGKTLPAGEYAVRRSLEGPIIVLTIQSMNNNWGVYLLTHPVRARDFQQESKLVFNHYDDRYFLSQVWLAGRNSGEELTKTRRERLLQREMAKRSGKPETISLAGRLK